MVFLFFYLVRGTIWQLETKRVLPAAAYKTPAGGLPFLFRQERKQRMRLKGSPRAPARDAVPLKNPPGPSIAGASVAAFGGSDATLEKKTYLKLLMRIPTPPAMRPGGGLGERGRDCGSKTYNALPQPTSLVPFLFGDKKGTRPCSRQGKTQRCLVGSM